MSAAPASNQWAEALRRRDYPSLKAWLQVQPNGLDQAMALETGQGLQTERPLVWAVRTQQWALASKLVSLGADPNVVSVDGTQTVLEAVVGTCVAAKVPWPPIVLELVENCLANGADPHARAQPINPPVLSSCLSDTIRQRHRSTKRAVDPVRNRIALLIWEQTQDRQWPPPVQWAVWFQVLSQKNQAWVQRLKLCGASPVSHDRALETTMAACLGRELREDKQRLEAAFELLAEFGMEWRSDEHQTGDDELRQAFAVAKAKRLEQQWQAEEVPAGRSRGRL